MHPRPPRRRHAPSLMALLTAVAVAMPARGATSDGPPTATTRPITTTTVRPAAATGPGVNSGYGTTQTRPTPAAGTTGTGAAGTTSEGSGGRRGGRDLVPVAVAGIAAIAVIGALLARERQRASQPAPGQLPPDELTARLLRDGPSFATEFNMSAFAVRGFVRGGWPMLIDFQQRSPGTARLRISARDLPEIFTYELSEICPAPRRCLIRFELPREIFGDNLQPAVIAAIATNEQGRQTQPDFAVYALGAGPRAVGSVAIDQVAFGPPTIRVTAQQAALYRFFSHSDFSNTAVEFWKVQSRDDGSKHSFVDDRFIDGGVHKNQWIGLDERKEWNGLVKGQQVSSGRHKVQVRAWDRVGDWVTAWSDSMVLVGQ